MSDQLCRKCGLRHQGLNHIFDHKFEPWAKASISPEEAAKLYAQPAQEVEPSAPAASFPEMEVRATVALDGGTRRACNNENCSNDYPCSRHTEFGEGGELPLPEQSAAGMGLTGQCDGQPQGNTHPLSNEPSPSVAASGQAGAGPSERQIIEWLNANYEHQPFRALLLPFLQRFAEAFFPVSAPASQPPCNYCGAPASVRLIGNRPPTEEEIKMGMELEPMAEECLKRNAALSAPKAPAPLELEKIATDVGMLANRVFRATWDTKEEWQDRVVEPIKAILARHLGSGEAV